MSFSSSDALEAVLRTLIGYLAIVASQALIGLRYFYRCYPDAARVMCLIVVAYFVFRSFMRIVRFWWGVFTFAVKAAVFFVVVVAALCAYYRGPYRFFSKDVPLMYQLWQLYSQKQKESIKKTMQYAEMLANTRIDPVAVQKQAAEWISENADQIDYIKKEAKHLATENMEYVHNFVKSGNLQNILNMGRNHDD